MLEVDEAGRRDGGGHGRAGTFRSGSHGELVQGSLSISPYVGREKESAT